MDLQHCVNTYEKIVQETRASYDKAIHEYTEKKKGLPHPVINLRSVFKALHGYTYAKLVKENPNPETHDDHVFAKRTCDQMKMENERWADVHLFPFEERKNRACKEWKSAVVRFKNTSSILDTEVKKLRIAEEEEEEDECVHTAPLETPDEHPVSRIEPDRACVSGELVCGSCHTNVARIRSRDCDHFVLCMGCAGLISDLSGNWDISCVSCEKRVKSFVYTNE